MQGVEVPVWAGFAGLDVVRGADGEFRVLEDNLRMPTGLGFAPLAWEVVGGVLGPALPGAPAGRARASALERFAAVLRAAGSRRRRRPVDRRARRRLRERRAVGDLRRRLPHRACRWSRSTTSASATAARTPTSTGAGARSTSSTGARTTTCCATRTARPSALAEQAARADAARHRDRRQPARGGDRRRQARPRLRPGDDPLLPRRGAGDGARDAPTTSPTTTRARTCSAGWARWSSRSATASAARAC